MTNIFILFFHYVLSPRPILPDLSHTFHLVALRPFFAKNFSHRKLFWHGWNGFGDNHDAVFAAGKKLFYDPRRNHNWRWNWLLHRKKS